MVADLLLRLLVRVCSLDTVADDEAAEGSRDRWLRCYTEGVRPASDFVFTRETDQKGGSCQDRRLPAIPF